MLFSHAKALCINVHTFKFYLKEKGVALAHGMQPASVLAMVTQCNTILYLHVQSSGREIYGNVLKNVKHPFDRS